MSFVVGQLKVFVQLLSHHRTKTQKKFHFGAQEVFQFVFRYYDFQYCNLQFFPHNFFGQWTTNYIFSFFLLSHRVVDNSLMNVSYLN